MTDDLAREIEAGHEPTISEVMCLLAERDALREALEKIARLPQSNLSGDLNFARLLAQSVLERPE
jgi:hypothetical protein